ncbi:MAG: ABC transporter permease, partial [Alphaproteobacteria bacterium]
MKRYVLRRLLAMPLLVLGVVTIAFMLSHFTKGDPLTAIVNEQQMNDPEVVAA